MMWLILYIFVCSVYSGYVIDRELGDDVLLYSRMELFISFILIAVFAPFVLLNDLFT